MSNKFDNGFAEAPVSGLLPNFEAVDVQSLPDKPHFANHRQRLRDRFMKAGSTALADYELPELLLFRAIPRREVKPLAKQLLAEFGDFNRVISAPGARLRRVKGVGEAAVQELKIVEAAAHRLGQSRVMGKNVLTSWSTLMEYCKISMAHRETE